jgi:hypothetical protein
MLVCGGRCVDTSNNHENCGACGTVCGAQQQCVTGICQNKGTTACTGSGSTVTFVDLQTDRANCGACGRACGGSEVCKNGYCDPCPIGQCNNLCTDTQRDPANCGGCGVAAMICENGTPVPGVTKPISIELTPPLTIPAVGPNSAVTNFNVKVHSQLRATKVTVKVAGAGSACGPSATFGTATDMTVSAPPEVSPTTWSGSVTSPATLNTVAIQIDAYDEQYLPSRTDAAQHTDSKCVTANVLAANAAVITSANITATAPATTACPSGAGIGSSTCCGGAACRWVPLNLSTPTGNNASITVAASGVPANTAKVEFRTADCVLATPQSCTVTANSLGSAPVVSGTATLPPLAPAELLVNGPINKADVTIFACPIDAAGFYNSTTRCTAMPTTTCASGPCAFSVGRIAMGAGSQPVVGKDADGATRTIYYLASTQQLLGQDYAKLNSSASEQPGAIIGGTYFLDSLRPTADADGVYAIKADGTQIHRVDCNPNRLTPPLPANFTNCLQSTFVTGGTFRQIAGATPAAMLIADNTTVTGGSGTWYYSVATKPAQTAAVTNSAVATGTLQSFTSLNGCTLGTVGCSTAASISHFGTTTSGAMAAWFSSGGTTPAFSPIVFHPNLSGNHTQSLFSLPSLSSFDLVVFPTGEMVYQYVTAVATGTCTTAPCRFLGAAYYDGIATSVKVLPAVQIGANTSTVAAKRFITAGTGILLGEAPSAADNTKFQAIYINLNTLAVPSAPVNYNTTYVYNGSSTAASSAAAGPPPTSRSATTRPGPSTSPTTPTRWWALPTRSGACTSSTSPPARWPPRRCRWCSPRTACWRPRWESTSRTSSTARPSMPAPTPPARRRR